MSVYYEWDIEWVDPASGDILDHDHAARLDEYPQVKMDSIDGDARVLVLVRMVGNDLDGETDRSWAYAERDDDGLLALPAETDGGGHVPNRFHAELAANSSRGLRPSS